MKKSQRMTVWRKIHINTGHLLSLPTLLLRKSHQINYQHDQRHQTLSQTKKRKQGNDVGSGLDHALVALAKDTLCRNRLNDIGKNNVVNNIVILAEQFKRMSDALGSKIKAANSCKDFE
jgi:hypothetical protein